MLPTGVTGLLDRNSQFSSLHNHRALVRRGRVRNLAALRPRGKVRCQANLAMTMQESFQT